MDPIINRIIDETGIKEIRQSLTQLSLADLHSLLLSIYQEKAGNLADRDMLEQASQCQYVQPSGVPQSEMAYFDNLAYQTLPQSFKPVELSPVACLGMNSVHGGISQNKVMTTTKGVEVVADPTTALAVLCAKGRRLALTAEDKSLERISLATSHRVIRQQSVSPEKGYTPHFRVFALATAGCDSGHDKFEKEVISEHLTFYLRLISVFLRNKLQKKANVVVSLSDTRIVPEMRDKLPDVVERSSKISRAVMREHKVEHVLFFLNSLEREVFNSLREKFPWARFVFNLNRTEGLQYYSGPCIRITAIDTDGVERRLVGGGVTRWTQALVGSRKERFFGSGIGSELLCRYF